MALQLAVDAVIAAVKDQPKDIWQAGALVALPAVELCIYKKVPGGKKRSVAGTLFGGNKPRIVKIENIVMEAELGPHMLFVRNRDRPGFIGNLGRMLAEAGINIATLHLGREAAGEEAICLISVDQPLDEAVLAHVCAIANVMQVRQLHF